MFAEVDTPDFLPAHELDAYLERGWFRMGQTIFTTNFAHVKDKLLSTIWLRVVLDNYKEDSTQTKLFKRNTIFRTTIKPAEVSADKEELYANYRQSLPFVVSESLHHLLFGKGDTHSIYTTYEVTVHDGERLIACGFFDLGQTSAQGITSFYDPAYKKYSLGKYLIYKKMEYCKNQRMRYFYPGYFVPGHSFFDYKLTIGRSALEFLTMNRQWLNIDFFQDDFIPVEVMRKKLMHVQDVLQHVALNGQVLSYEFFDANLIPDLRNSGLLDFPIFLAVTDIPEDMVNPIIVYDVRVGQYHIYMCAPVWKPDGINPDKTFYSAFFLKPMQEIYASAEVEKIAAVFLKFFSRSKTAEQKEPGSLQN